MRAIRRSPAFLNSPPFLHSSGLSCVHSQATCVRGQRLRVGQLRAPFRRRPALRGGVAGTVCIGGGGGRGDGREEGLGGLVVRVGRFLQSSTGQAVTWGLLVWLVLTGRAGFIFDTVLWAFGLLTVVPVVAVVAFRWWVGRSVIEGTCPNCGAAVTGMKGQPFRCFSCGQVIKAEQGGGFGLNDPTKATVDVDAKAVDVDVID